ncbi:MAG: carboxypeptidase regulatory-like domain-containing protein, partial [Planctomycetota bacterium]
VSGAMQGQKVVFLNSDNLPHNVHLLAENNPGLNELMPGKDQRLPRRFKKPEVMIEAKCDIHPWMRAYFGIVPHPWFAVTGPDGAFVLNDVPPGEYVLETWHEVYGRVTQKVTVPPRGEATARFRYQAP